MEKKEISINLLLECEYDFQVNKVKELLIELLKEKVIEFKYEEHE